MKRIVVFSALLVGATTALGALASSQSAGQQQAAQQDPAPATFRVDTVHSSVIFRIKHQGVAFFYGRFNGVSGSYNYDPQSPESAGFEIEVPVESVDTGNDGRDGHLKGPEFFNASEFPTMSFKSTQVQKKDDDTLTVTGDFTMRGVTKAITVDIDITGLRDGPRGSRVSGIETVFTIKRSEFGMTAMQGDAGLGDDVRLIISLEARAR